MSYSRVFFQDILNRTLDDEVNVLSVSPVSGGCIHHAQKITTDRGLYFIKLNQSSGLNMFRTEFSGLELLANANEIDVPVPIGFGIESGQAYLLTEYIDSRHRSSNFWVDFGRFLAILHRNHQNDRYGLSYNNYIGRLDQYNDFHDNWLSFFISQRLEVQIKLAFDNGYIDKAYLERFNRFYNKLPDLLPEEPASLLHGDLWSGNFMTGEKGQPVIIDPAVYYGNREIELSFTQMFGGFDSIFYRAYQEVYPLSPDFNSRVEIYNLYPYLVHVNMFGTSYLSGVDRVVRKYV
jgi:protein-ribulosamine 3-kinase